MLLCLRIRVMNTILKVIWSYSTSINIQWLQAVSHTPHPEQLLLGYINFIHCYADSCRANSTRTSRTPWQRDAENTRETARRLRPGSNTHFDANQNGIEWRILGRRAIETKAQMLDKRLQRANVKRTAHLVLYVKVKHNITASIVYMFFACAAKTGLVV